MRERETRGCLSDDREQRTRALELELEVAGSLARPQGVCDAHGKRRQRIELLLRRRRLAETELENPERRLSELHGNDGASPFVRIGFVDAERLPALEHRRRKLAPALERRRAAGVEKSEQLELVAARPPDRDAEGARCRRGNPHGVLRRLRENCSRGQRLAGLLERAHRVDEATSPGIELGHEPQRLSKLRREDLRDAARLVVEPPGRVVQLDRADGPVADPGRDGQGGARFVLVAEKPFSRRCARARYLGHERRTCRRRRTRDERPCDGIEHADDGELCPRRLGRGCRNHLQRGS